MWNKCNDGREGTSRESADHELERASAVAQQRVTGDRGGLSLADCRVLIFIVHASSEHGMTFHQ